VASAKLHKRILFLGPTGVDKAKVAARLSSELSTGFSHEVRFVDFENEFLKRHMAVKSWMSFLAQDIRQQASAWRAAWREFVPSLDDRITIVGLHATFVSGILGLRSAIDIPGICNDLKPSLIVTLIDDVYTMWSRTEARAEGNDHKGRPSFEQLLVARRAEQVLGDLILAHANDGRVRHVLCATGNSLQALVNLVVFDAQLTYLSFPISAPRELAEKGDRSFIALINKAHQLAARQMRHDRSRAFASPLSIDELPILNALAGLQKGESAQFDCARDRWRLDELWGSPDEPIICIDSGNRTFPMEQIDGAVGLIKADLGARDRRLVLQSSSLAIVCPKPPGEERITRGVREEIDTAVAIGMVCYFWQDPAWDPGDYVGKIFPPAGSMGIGQTQALVQRKNSLEELIRAKP